jgi:hypothetical protein
VTHPVDENTRRLLHLRYAAAALEECRRSLREAVAQAREVGVPWTQIGELLSLSPQAARRQFGDGPEAPG